jgi:hypothetical protein
MPDTSALMNNDELSAFVSSTLRAIAAGVDDAAQTSRTNTEKGFSTFEMPDKVAFDVAVTARKSGEKGGGVKIEIYRLGGGVDAKRSEGQETASRIQFEVGWKYTHTAPVSKPTVPSTSFRK